MADMGVGEALLISSLITAAATGASTAVQYDAQQEAAHEQKKAQEAAAEEQRIAAQEAETQRLEGLKTASTKTDYANVWGSDTAKYADAAQKLSAGTGNFNTEDEETNPFYTRGLV